MPHLWWSVSSLWVNVSTFTFLLSHLLCENLYLSPFLSFFLWGLWGLIKVLIHSPFAPFGTPNLSFYPNRRINSSFFVESDKRFFSTTWYITDTHSQGKCWPYGKLVLMDHRMTQVSTLNLTSWPWTCWFCVCTGEINEKRLQCCIDLAKQRWQILRCTWKLHELIEIQFGSGYKTRIATRRQAPEAPADENMQAARTISWRRFWRTTDKIDLQTISLVKDGCWMAWTSEGPKGVVVVHGPYWIVSLVVVLIRSLLDDVRTARFVSTYTYEMT